MKNILSGTLKLCNRCQRETIHLLKESENPLDYYSKKQPWWKRSFYFCLIVYRGFTKNRCFVRSTALSYATLLALVPMLALVVSITAGLLKTQSGEEQIANFTEKAISYVVPQLNLLGNQDVMQDSFSEDQLDRQKVIDYVNSLVSNIRGGALGVTGMVSLIAVVILLLTKIEDAFNDIWDVESPRGWSVRVLYYWGMITLGPLMLFVGLSLFGSDKIAGLQKIFSYMPAFGTTLFKYIIIKGLPYFLIILAFTLLYYFMPSTKVNWDAALIGGIFTGLLWQLNSTYSVVYASSVVSYSKMYGMLAAVPILLAGLYLSWLFVLLGCQVAYAWQNRHLYVQNKIASKVAQKDKELTGIRIMVAIGKCHENGEKPLTAEELSEMLTRPIPLVEEILGSFMESGIVIKTDKDGYAPNLPLNKVNCYHVLSSLNECHNDFLTEEGTHARVVEEIYYNIRSQAQNIAEKITISDILAKESLLKKES